MDQGKIDLLAIGDVVIDTFIRLKEAGVSGMPDTPEYKLCLPFAEKVPYEYVSVCHAVGNAPNAATSAARLGLRSALATNAGDDRDGEDCLAALKREGIDTSFVKINKGAKTNNHYVLWYNAERTILIKHENYEYTLPDIDDPKWVYFSSVNENAFPFHNILAEYLEKHPNVKLAFQPGKFEIKLGKEKLARLYQRADMFFCNVEEAEKILGISSLEVKKLLEKMRELGPKVVVITDGPKGAYVYDGKEYLFMEPYPDPKPPFERTGAGDAFSSTIVAATILGKTLPEAMMWAGVNSMAVVQEIGAQKGLLSREKLEEWLAKAPADYKVKNI